ncbi:MAG: DNA replication/repair protein RecF [Clostridia bacterium]|nr:DNA replication/repair protein RecF [Clostridia bacterium]
MKCREIELTNFRNIRDEKIEFSDGINVLWGKNAQGKSNVLEAVYYFARGRSFRGAKDRDAVMFGSDFTRFGIKCRGSSSEYDTSLEVVIPADENMKKRVFRNGAPISGVGEMIGSFRAVLFCPAHLSLVNGSPTARRSFLDIAISQLSKEYMTKLSEYKKLLAERNAALKAAAKGEESPAELWETFAEQMSRAASRISSYRFEYMSMLSAEMEKLFSEMTGGAEKPSLSYSSHSIKKTGRKAGDPEEDESEIERGEIEAGTPAGFGQAEISPDCLKEKLLFDLEREIRHGSTMWGPHKDDIKIKLNGRDAKVFASQGQMRSLALTMKLSEGALSFSIGGEEPVILLDDVLSELDGDRRDFVLGSLGDRQIIVTSCEPELFGGTNHDVSLLHVEDGRISKL